jgi:hypothetical protein
MRRHVAWATLGGFLSGVLSTIAAASLVGYSIVEPVRCPPRIPGAIAPAKLQREEHGPPLQR